MFIATALEIPWEASGKTVLSLSIKWSAGAVVLQVPFTKWEVDFHCLYLPCAFVSMQYTVFSVLWAWVLRCHLCTWACPLQSCFETEIVIDWHTHQFARHEMKIPSATLHICGSGKSQLGLRMLIHITQRLWDCSITKRSWDSGYALCKLSN